MTGFILVGAGEWRSSGIMAMAKGGGVYFGVRRGRVATVFPTARAAAMALKRTNEERDGIEAVTATVVRLIPAPKDSL